MSSTTQSGVSRHARTSFTRPLNSPLNHSRLLFSTLTALLFLFAGISIVHPKRMDFAVYWYDVHAYFFQGLPLYGPRSAFAAPMLFRYPPVFALLFSPLTLLSFKAAGAVWALLEALTLTAVTCWAYRMLHLNIELSYGLIGLAISAPYFYLSFKDGNMQWIVTVLLLSALLSAAEWPAIAGFALALGIAIKVWPLLFLPLFFTRSRIKTLLAAAGWSLLIWSLPILLFGAPRYFALLQSWVQQEYATNVGPRDIWYPSQSLRGVLLRFFTDPALTLPYHAAFPDVHLLTLPPRLIIDLWLLLAIPAFAYSVWRKTPLGVLYFVAFSALQPFCNWSSLITLTPAALVAAHLAAKNPKARWWFLLTFAFCCVGYAASLSRGSTRLFEVLGLHFAIMSCLWFCLQQSTSQSFSMAPMRGTKRLPPSLTTNPKPV